MKKGLFGICAVTLATALSGAGAARAASLNTSMCTNPTVSQEFLPWGDTNYYAPIAGMNATSFTASGWTLSGGASIVTTQLPNGTTGTVLDLPSGAKAQSPVACVQNNYPTGRGWVRNVKGSGGVGFYVSYELTKGWQAPKQQGTLNASGTPWALPGALSIQPTGASGWQPVIITLTGNGTASEFQVSDFQLDPRMH